MWVELLGKADRDVGKRSRSSRAKRFENDQHRGSASVELPGTRVLI